MSIEDKNINKNFNYKNRACTVSERVVNYENHPFFIEKAEKAKKLIAKVGLPPDFVQK